MCTKKSNSQEFDNVEIEQERNKNNNKMGKNFIWWPFRRKFLRAMAQFQKMWR